MTKDRFAHYRKKGILQDRYEEGMNCFVDSLPDQGDKRVIEPLIGGLKDEDKDVREAAKAALEKIKAKKS